MAKTITVSIDVEIPKCANFLRMSDGQTVPVSAVPDEGLREIGRLYGEALVRRAAEQREADHDGP